MNSKVALFLAIILGAFAAISVRMYIAGIEKKEMESKTLRKIVIANKSLKANHILQATDIDFVMVEQRLYSKENMLTDSNANDIINRPIYYDVGQGEIILKSYTIPTNTSGGADSSLLNIQSNNAKLNQLEKAVTLKVDQLTGVAMLLKPSDHIDVFWTGQTTPEISKFLGITTTEINANVDKVTVLLLSDVYIMALDNRYGLSPTVARDRLINPKENYGSVTVRCRNYEEAKMLIHAQSSGKLTMVKRGDDNQVIDSDNAVDILEMLKVSRKVNAMRQKRGTGN